MPSVHAYYQGRLTEEEAQDRLAARIRQIARFVAPRAGAAVRELDLTIDRPVLAGADCRGHEGFLALQHVRVAGPELRIVDLRRDEHVFSFAFLREVAPLRGATRRLQGRLVQLHSEGECRRFRHPRIRRAEWYVQTHGGSMLRYQFEESFDLLMAYVRTFHVPGMYYWRYAALQRLGGFGTWVREMSSRGPGRVSLEEAAASLEQHARVCVFRRFDDTAWLLDLPEGLRGMVRTEGTVEALAVAMVVGALRAEAFLGEP